MLVYGWKLVDYPEKLGPEGQFYSPIIWESVNLRIIVFSVANFWVIPSPYLCYSEYSLLSNVPLILICKNSRYHDI